MKLSARNVLKGKVKSITPGSVNSEVILELPGGQDIVSVVTTIGEGVAALFGLDRPWRDQPVAPMRVELDDPYATGVSHALSVTGKSPNTAIVDFGGKTLQTIDELFMWSKNHYRLETLATNNTPTTVPIHPTYCQSYDNTMVRGPPLVIPMFLHKFFKYKAVEFNVDVFSCEYWAMTVKVSLWRANQPYDPTLVDEVPSMEFSIKNVRSYTFKFCAPWEYDTIVASNDYPASFGNETPRLTFAVTQFTNIAVAGTMTPQIDIFARWVDMRLYGPLPADNEIVMDQDFATLRGEQPDSRERLRRETGHLSRDSERRSSGLLFDTHGGVARSATQADTVRNPVRGQGTAAQAKSRAADRRVP